MREEVERVRMPQGYWSSTGAYVDEIWERNILYFKNQRYNARC